MTELVEFLNARLDEDEALAALASAQGGGPHWILPSGDTEITSRDLLVSQPTRVAFAEHIVRWDPASVLAEVAAKRKIVSVAETLSVSEGGKWAASELLKLLAQPYADHSDFDPAWRT